MARMLLATSRFRCGHAADRPTRCQHQHWAVLSFPLPALESRRVVLGPSSAAKRQCILAAAFSRTCTLTDMETKEWA